MDASVWKVLIGQVGKETSVNNEVHLQVIKYVLDLTTVRGPRFDQQLPYLTI